MVYLSIIGCSSNVYSSHDADAWPGILGQLAAVCADAARVDSLGNPRGVHAHEQGRAASLDCAHLHFGHARHAAHAADVCHLLCPVLRVRHFAYARFQVDGVRCGVHHQLRRLLCRNLSLGLAVHSARSIRGSRGAGLFASADIFVHCDAASRQAYSAGDGQRDHHAGQGHVAGVCHRRGGDVLDGQGAGCLASEHGAVCDCGADLLGL